MYIKELVQKSNRLVHALNLSNRNWGFWKETGMAIKLTLYNGSIKQKFSRTIRLPEPVLT